MTAFAIICHTEFEKVLAAVDEHYAPEERFVLAPAAIFVADTGSAATVANKLGITEGRLGAQAIVFQAQLYSGWVRQDLWTWLRPRISGEG